MTTAEVTARDVADALNGVRTGGGWLANCPAHPDTHRSLTIAVGEKHPVVVNCKTGCQQSDVIAALREMGLWATGGGAGGATGGATAPKRRQSEPAKWRAVVPVPEGVQPPDFRHHKHGNPSAVYEYRDISGGLVQYIARYDPPGQRKQFCPFTYASLLAERKWQKQQLVTPRPLYNANLIAARTHDTIVLVEGEKCADWMTANLPEYIAVTWPGGAANATNADLQPLHGRAIVIWPDHDAAGMQAAAYLETQLASHVRSLATVAIPEGKPAKWDCADSTADEARSLIEDAVAPPVDIQAEADAYCATLNRTDLGNAERIQRRHGDDLLYCYDTGYWHMWDGSRWNMDNGAAIVACACGCARRIMTGETSHIADPDLRSKHARWGLASESSGRIANALTLARSLLNAPIDKFDVRDDLLNTPSGTLNISTGELLPHDRKQHLTKITSAAHDPEADCPTWMTFLRRIMDNDSEMVSFLQRAVGYSITGSTREQCLFVMHGTGSNGKSTFLNALKTIFGGYARQADPSTFMATKFDNRGPRPDLVALRGARFVSAIEVEEGQRFAEALVKTLTGQDTVSTRDLYGKQFEFIPQFKVWIAANHRPVIRGQDPGIWRRIRLIPFNACIGPSERNPNLPEELLEERDGILRWATDGARQWLEHGLGMPDAVKSATDDYRSESDRLGSFIASECVTAGYATVRASNLYHAYKQWCETNGERCESMTAFGKRITERGIEKVETNRGIEYNGLGLIQKQRDYKPDHREELPF